MLLLLCCYCCCLPFQMVCTCKIQNVRLLGCLPKSAGIVLVSIRRAATRERARISLPFSESIYVILCMCARVAAAATAAELYGPCLVCTSSIHAQYLLKFYIYSLTSSFLLTLFGWAFGYMYVSLWIFAQDIVFTDASSACFSPFFPLSSTHFSSFTIFFLLWLLQWTRRKKTLVRTKWPIHLEQFFSAFHL